MMWIRWTAELMANAILCSDVISNFSHHVKLMCAFINIWFAVSVTKKFHSLPTNVAFCRVQFFPSNMNEMPVLKYWSYVNPQIIQISLRIVRNFAFPWWFCHLVACNWPFVQSEQYSLISFSKGNHAPRPVLSEIGQLLEINGHYFREICTTSEQKVQHPLKNALWQSKKDGHLNRTTTTAKIHEQQLQWDVK